MKLVFIQGHGYFQPAFVESVRGDDYGNAVISMVSGDKHAIEGPAEYIIDTVAEQINEAIDADYTAKVKAWHNYESVAPAMSDGMDVSEDMRGPSA